MNAWPYWGSADFRPLLQQLDRQGDVRALVALAEIDPLEERPAIIRDLASPYPKLFHEGYQASETFGRMAPMPLPQFDDLFRKRLKLTLRNRGSDCPAHRRLRLLRPASRRAGGLSPVRARALGFAGA